MGKTSSSGMNGEQGEHSPDQSMSGEHKVPTFTINLYPFFLPSKSMKPSQRLSHFLLGTHLAYGV